MLLCVLVSIVAVTNYHKMGGLKQQIFFISKSSTLEVRNRGVVRVGSLEGLGEKTTHASLLTSGESMLIPWFVIALLLSLSLSSDGMSPSCVYLCIAVFSLYKDTSH